MGGGRGRGEGGGELKLDGVVGGILNELYMMNMIYHIIALMTDL